MAVVPGSLQKPPWVQMASLMLSAALCRQIAGSVSWRVTCIANLRSSYVMTARHNNLSSTCCSHRPVRNAVYALFWCRALLVYERNGNSPVLRGLPEWRSTLACLLSDSLLLS